MYREVGVNGEKHTVWTQAGVAVLMSACTGQSSERDCVLIPFYHRGGREEIASGPVKNKEVSILTLIYSQQPWSFSPFTVEETEGHLVNDLPSAPQFVSDWLLL